MRLVRQLGFLRVALTGRRTAVADNRVLDLFRNRAELKKAFIAAQEEVLQLKDRIKQQEGATARVQEMLESLEARLASPASSYGTVVFYQLRDLWALGRALLTQFVNELAAQREDHERKQFLAEHNRLMFARRQTAESEYLAAETTTAEARTVVVQIEESLRRHGQWWFFFKRRALKHQLQAAGVQALLATQQLTTARNAREAIAAEAEPEFPGLSVGARRAINLAAIAYAQVLCARLMKTKLLEPARDASSRREPPEAGYGDRARCETLIADIQRARLILEQRTSVQQDVRQGVETLRPLAKYRSDGDTLPSAESLAQPGDGTRVLLDDSWEIHRLLLR